jgi:hypothetical protein
MKTCFAASELRVKITTVNLENERKKKTKNKTDKPVATYLNGLLLFAGFSALLSEVWEGERGRQ